MKGKYSKKHHGKKESDSGPPPGPVDIQPGTPPEQAEPKTAHKQPSKKGKVLVQKPDPFDLAIWGLIATVVIAGIYFFQLRAMRDAVTISKDTMKVSQRAFVAAKEANIVGEGPNVVTPPPRIPGQVVDVQVTYKNSGQTWARNVSGSINFLLDPKGIPSDFTWPVESYTQPVLLAPQVVDNAFVKPISDSDLAKAKSGKFNFFVYGDIKYQDVFDEWHRTEYCYQLFGVDLHPDKTINKYLFFEGPQHNCADNDCAASK